MFLEQSLGIDLRENIVRLVRLGKGLRGISLIDHLLKRYPFPIEKTTPSEKLEELINDSQRGYWEHWETEEDEKERRAVEEAEHSVHGREESGVEPQYAGNLCWVGQEPAGQTIEEDEVAHLKEDEDRSQNGSEPKSGVFPQGQQQ